MTSVVFYDGVCGLCNRLVRFLLRRDHHGRLLFAPLQGEIARAALAGHDADPSDLDTVYVLAHWNSPSQRVLSRSRAVLHALEQLGGGWRLAASAARVVPAPVADILYRLIAKTRYRVFGQLTSCPVPPPEWRSRFLE
jgi:predicted DCC family thiol-disulfide oxidoreductase YuxK